MSHPSKKFFFSCRGLPLGPVFFFSPTKATGFELVAEVTLYITNETTFTRYARRSVANYYNVLRIHVAKQEKKKKKKKTYVTPGHCQKKGPLKWTFFFTVARGRHSRE